MRLSSNRSDAAVVPVVAVVVSSGVGDRSRLSGSIVLVLRCGGVLAPYKVRSAAPAEGLPRARRPESVERRRRGALGCPAARTGTSFQWQCLGQTGAFARQSNATAASRSRPGDASDPWLAGETILPCLLVSYRPLARFFKGVDPQAVSRRRRAG